MRSQRLAFAPRVRFDANQVCAVLAGIACERVKGTLQTAGGAVRIDGTAGEVNLAPQPGLTDNRLVLIGEYELERQTLEQRIMTAALPV